MENQIIIGVLLVLVFVGIRSGVKHFARQGGCCGGGSSVKVRRKRLKKVIRQRTIEIEGMSCKHCKERVENRLNEMDGISAKVDLKEKTAVVSMEKDVSDEELVKVIVKAGYEVTGIR